MKALLRFPDVVRKLSDDLDWTTSLGDAIVNQPQDVANVIQELRAKAQNAGTLKTTKEQVVTTQKQDGRDVVTIESADPSVIYVPSYDPVAVYNPLPWLEGIRRGASYLWRGCCHWISMARQLLELGHGSVLPTHLAWLSSMETALRGLASWHANRRRWPISTSATGRGAPTVVATGRRADVLKASAVGFGGRPGLGAALAAARVSGAAPAAARASGVAPAAARVSGWRWRPPGSRGWRWRPPGSRGWRWRPTRSRGWRWRSSQPVRNLRRDPQRDLRRDMGTGLQHGLRTGLQHGLRTGLAARPAHRPAARHLRTGQLGATCAMAAIAALGRAVTAASTSDEAALGEASTEAEAVFTAVEVAFEVVGRRAADGDPIFAGLSTRSSGRPSQQRPWLLSFSVYNGGEKSLCRSYRAGGAKGDPAISRARSGRLSEGLLQQGRAEISNLRPMDRVGRRGPAVAVM